MTGERRGSHRYDSLEQALRAKHYPIANDALIKTLMTGIGIEGYYETTGYIKAERLDGGTPLNINFGSTNGFASEEEIRAILGEDVHVKSADGQRNGTWRVRSWSVVDTRA